VIVVCWQCYLCGSIITLHLLTYIVELRWHRDRLGAVAVAAKAREWKARKYKWRQGNVSQGTARECKGW
jgi:hypothetical protein